MDIVSSRMGISKRLARGAFGAILVSFLALSGCGGDDQDAPRPSMTGAASTAQKAGSNRSPVVESVAVSPARPAPGRRVVAQVDASDPDGDRTQLRYTWRDVYGRRLGEGRFFETDGLEPGEGLEVEVVATDGELESEPMRFAFALADARVDVALVAIESEEGTQPGVLLEAYVESSDESSGGYDVLYEWSVRGETVGTDDELDTTPLSPGDPVVLTARLEFEDRTTRPVRSSPFVLGRGAAPRIVSEPAAGIEGGLFRYRLRAESDEPGAELEYALLDGPDGMRVDPSTGQVTWRPAADQRGRFEIELVARDQWGTGTSQAFSIEVESPSASSSPPASPR